MDYKKINEDFYNANWWGIDRSRNKWFGKYVRIKVLEKFMRQIKNKGVLYDAGGGVGNYGAYFLKDFKKVIVSDISKTALSRIPEKEIVKINCSVLNNKLKDNSVDFVLLVDVFEHIEEKDLPIMMKDLKRILKPEGRILIFTNLYGWGFGMILQRLFKPKKRLMGEEEKEGHVNRLKFNEFKTLFKKTGLKIDDYYFYSVIFQQITDLLKDGVARIGSLLLRRGKEDMKKGREGQSIKEDLKKKEQKKLFKVPLLFLSWISYLDVLLFGKLIRGNSIFLSLKK